MTTCFHETGLYTMTSRQVPFVEQAMLTLPQQSMPLSVPMLYNVTVHSKMPSGLVIPLSLWSFSFSVQI
jgi:hypothetical protein